MPRSAAGRAPTPDVGTGLIVGYKAAKALLEVSLVAGLVLAAHRGGALRHLAGQVEAHLASRWAVEAVRALRALASPRGRHLLEAGLSLDALLAALEGWSLWRGYRWGPWLVILATVLPLPWEAWEIARHRSAARVGVALVNLAVVAYLGWRLARERRPRR